MNREEITMKSEKIYDGKILSLKLETVELPDKKYSKREIVEHAAATAIIAVDENDNVFMIKQYRKAIEKTIYEIPAGILEIGESPKNGALREFEEETGHRANNMDYLCEFYSSPGFCTEKIYLFEAKDFELSEPNLDEDEFLEFEKIPFEKVMKMIELGEIVDAKTVIGVLFYANLRREK